MIGSMVSIIRLIFKWGVRVAIIVGVILFFAVIATSTLGGKGDIARASLERVIFGMTGVRATVHGLNDYRLFPEFKIDFKDMAGRLDPQNHLNLPLKSDHDLPDVILEKFIFIQSPFRHLWGGAAILRAEFDNLIIRPGVFGPHALHLKTGRIVGPIEKDAHLPQPPAQFVMTGDYGGHTVVISVPLITMAAGGQWYYRVDGTSDLSVRVGDIVATGRLNIKDNEIIFDHVQVKVAGTVLSGVITVPKTRLNANNPLVSLALVTDLAESSYLVQLGRFDDVVSARVVSGDITKQPWPRVVRDVQKILKQK